MTDNVLRTTGYKCLAEKLGRVNAERFISLMIAEPFDYTSSLRGLRWRRCIIGKPLNVFRVTLNPLVRMPDLLRETFDYHVLQQETLTLVFRFNQPKPRNLNI